MNMEGEQRIAAPRQRVWEALNDPEILRASIPGCQSLTREADDRFSAIVEVKVGPIGARFKGAVTLRDLDPAKGYTLILEGNGGIAGSVSGSARVRLSDDAGGTLVTYQVDAQMGGRMAQLGGPIIDATAKQLAGKFFNRFGEIVGGNATNPVTEEAHAIPGTPAASVATTTTPQSGNPGVPVSAVTSPITWLLGSVVAALIGFMVGRSQAAIGSDWAGLAIGLLIVVVAGAAFEYGRRSASRVVVLDSAALRRLLDGDSQ